MSTRQILVQVLGNKCSFCASTEKLEIHHVDKNRTNPKLSNIMLLCKTCHSKAHQKLHKKGSCRIITVRQDLYNKLEEYAKKTCRSIPKVVEYLLQKATEV